MPCLGDADKPGLVELLDHGPERLGMRPGYGRLRELPT